MVNCTKYNGQHFNILCAENFATYTHRETEISVWTIDKRYTIFTNCIQHTNTIQNIHISNLNTIHYNGWICDYNTCIMDLFGKCWFQHSFCKREKAKKKARDIA